MGYILLVFMGNEVSPDDWNKVVLYIVCQSLANKINGTLLFIFKLR